MFAHRCTHCRRRQLISPGRITRIDNTDRGIVVLFHCWCGAEQGMVTGRRAPHPRTVRAA